MRSDRRRLRELERRVAELEATTVRAPEPSDYNGPPLTAANLKDAYDHLRAKGTRFVELRVSMGINAEAMTLVTSSNEMRALRRVVVRGDYAAREWHLEPFVT